MTYSYSNQDIFIIKTNPIQTNAGYGESQNIIPFFCFEFSVNFIHISFSWLPLNVFSVSPQGFLSLSFHEGVQSFQSNLCFQVHFQSY